MKKPIVCQIKKKKYYLYKITWIDITGEEDHANNEQFDKMDYSNVTELGELFYDIHVIANYILIALIIIHILAVITHKLFFSDNLLKRML